MIIIFDQFYDLYQDDFRDKTISVDKIELEPSTGTMLVYDEQGWSTMVTVHGLSKSRRTVKSLSICFKNLKNLNSTFQILISVILYGSPTKNNIENVDKNQL